MKVGLKWGDPMRFIDVIEMSPTSQSHYLDLTHFIINLSSLLSIFDD